MGEQDWKHVHCFELGESIPVEAKLVHVNGISYYYEVPGKRDDWVYPEECSE